MGFAVQVDLNQHWSNALARQYIVLQPPKSVRKLTRKVEGSSRGQDGAQGRVGDGLSPQRLERQKATDI
jgi:hypothetical protein